MSNADYWAGSWASFEPEVTFLNTWVSKVIWIAGLLSTVYLTGCAAFLSFLSLVFIDYSTPDFEWWKVAGVLGDSLPLCCFVAIGIVGLRSWPPGRFRFWGLIANVLQTALAIWVYAHPEGLLVFTR